MSGPQFTGNSLGILSDSAILSVGQIMFGGAVGVGNQATVNIHVGATTHPFTETGVSGDTLYTLINRLIVQINASLAPGITASLANPAVPMLAIAPLRNGSALPTIGYSVTGSITASIVSQPVNILDANPVLYAGHVNPLAAPVSGDCVALVQFVGADATNIDQPTVAYGWAIVRVVDPNLATLRGSVTFGTAAPKPANGYVANCFEMNRGLFLYDDDGNMPTGQDKGYGTINLPSTGGIYVNGVKVPLQKAAFRAHLTADQTGIADNVLTLLDFTYVPIVTGVGFDTTNRRWIPPAGMVELSATAMWANVYPNNFYVYICKNGANPLAGRNVVGLTASCSVDVIDYANGTDYYDARVLMIAGVGSAHTVRGLPYYTWFQGKQL